MPKKVVIRNSNRILVVSKAGPPGVPGEGMSVKDYGAVGDGTTDDTAAINAALDAAATIGRTVVFPKSTSYYKITDALTPPSGTSIRGAGKDSEIRQATQFKPVFDLFNVDNCTISDIYLVNGSGPPGSAGGSFRGDSQYAYSAGVWTNGSRHHLSNLYIKDFAMGVYFAATNSAGTVNNDGNQRFNNVARDLEIVGANHGILFLCQTGLTIDGLYSHDHVDSSAGSNPMHAIYGTGTATLYSNQVSVSNCVNINQSTGAAYQFKFINGLTLSNLQAKTCGGLFNGIDLNDVVGSGLVATGCTLVDAWTIQTVTNQSRRMNISNISMTMTADGRAWFSNVDDSIFSSVHITSNRNGANNALVDVFVAGNRTIYDTFRLNNTGSTNARSFCISSGSYTTSDITLRNFEVIKSNNLVDVYTAVTGANSIDYNPGAQKNIAFGTSNYITSVGGAITYSLGRRDHCNTYNVNGGTAYPLVGLETVTRFNVTSATAFAVYLPVIEPQIGMIHTIAVKNASGGSLGTVTWNAIYILTSGWVSPTNGLTKTIRFMYDGTNWIEIARS